MSKDEVLLAVLFINSVVLIVMSFINRRKKD